MKKARKIISLLLSVLMIITALPLTAVNSFAADNGITSGKYEYVVLDDGTAEITDYFGSATKLTIPSEIDGYKVTSVGSSAFYGCTSLTSVNIPDSVKSIGDHAFLICTSLTSITIPDGVTSIGVGVFGFCNSLTSITIPDSVTSIGDEAFYDCAWLTSVTIGNGVTRIGQSAFEDCKSLTSITIPDGVISIGDEAFYDCTSLISITIPNSVTSVGNRAFYNCTWLTSVTIGNGVKSIGYSAFYNCTWLTSVTIPNSVTRIGKKAFGYYHDERIHGFTIYGNKGSEAERYANKNGFKFAQAAPAPTMTFPDVRSGDWYYDAVKYNFERGYITGYSNGTFGPANNIQRQDFALILARIAGADLSAYEGQNGGFSDVPTNTYYSAAVAWAKDRGIVTGYSADNFGVGTFISREQICIMLCRYLNGSVLGNADTILNAYPDGGNTSPWAKESVAWAVENGIVGNAGYINPIGNAGRAEVAQIIYNMANKGMI